MCFAQWFVYRVKPLYSFDLYNVTPRYKTNVSPTSLVIGGSLDWLPTAPFFTFYFTIVSFYVFYCCLSGSREVWKELVCAEILRFALPTETLQFFTISVLYLYASQCIN